MRQLYLARQTCNTMTGPLRIKVLAFMFLTVACAHAQTDTTAPNTSLSSSSTDEARPSETLALFSGSQQGLYTEQGQDARKADWLLGAAPNIPLGGAWEFSPELALWHLTSTERAQVAPPFTGGKAIGKKWKWYMKLGLPFRWFPLRSGRFAAYALSGPACLLWKGAAMTLDIGGGLCWELSRFVTFTGEARTYLYYHTSESVVLASPVSLLIGVRLRQAK